MSDGAASGVIYTVGSKLSLVDMYKGIGGGQEKVLAAASISGNMVVKLQTRLVLDSDGSIRAKMGELLI